MVSKSNVGFKSPLHHGLWEPEFYSDLVYTFRKIMGKTDFSDELMIRYKRIGYNSNVMVQSVCLVINPIPIVNFAAL